MLKSLKTIHFFYILLWLLVFIFMGYFFINTNNISPQSEGQFLKGEVIKIQDETSIVRLNEGEIVRVEQNDYYLQDDYEVGDLVSVYSFESEEEQVAYEIADYYHLDGLIFIFIIFFFFAILIGKKKGLYSVISVVFSLLLFYVIVLGAVKSGFSLLLAGVLFIVLFTILTIPLIHGFNKKSLSAILAVNIGYLIAFLFTHFFVLSAHIGRTPSEEFRTLFFQFPELDIRQVLIFSLFLGVAGALIDVAVSICSAIFEGLKEHQNLSFTKTYKLGMTVGTDIMGSMINTLLIAYLATSLPFFVLLSLGGSAGFVEFINYDFIALEMVRIFIGSVSIILLIPLTSVISAYFLARRS